jgi:hypothetical protein
MHDAGVLAPLRQQSHQAAVVQRIGAHIVRDHAHAHALQRGHLQRQQIVGHIAHRVLHLLALAARAHQAPGAQAFLGRHGNRRQVLQILGVLGHGLALQHRGRGHQDAARHIQALDHHGAAVLHRVPHAQRHIDALFQQIDRVVGHPHFQPHARVQAQKLRHALGQHGLHQRHRAAHAHRAARLGLHLGHGVGRRLGSIAHGLAVAQIGLADLGQRQPPRGALHQAHAQPGFQLRDAARQPGLRDVQRPTRRSKAAALHHLGKVQHVVEVIHSKAPADCSKYETIYRKNAGLSKIVSAITLYPSHTKCFTHHWIPRNTMQLLHIDSSINGNNSASRKLTAQIVDAWKAKHADTQVSYLDLVAGPPTTSPPPPWPPHRPVRRPERRASDGKRRVRTPGAAIPGCRRGGDRCPFYNFSIPTQLKAWIDRLAQPGRTFRYTANGPEGLAKGKTVIIGLAWRHVHQRCR